MVSQQEDKELARCRRLIEEKTGWGSSDSWSTQDFDRLSDQIAAQTGISLSVTTLKRVWGRVRYDSAPTATTLNTLAQFLGYENWPQFKETAPTNTQQPASTAQPDIGTDATRDVPEPARLMPVTGNKRWWIGASLAIGLTGILVFFLNYSSPSPALSPTDFSFSSQPLARGLPNSVVFHYDATASPTDSVFIQQSWDPRRRELVPKNGHQYTSIYYHPGYFRAKLVVGKQIMKEHNLLIPSDGWHVAVIEEPVPIYFKASEAIHQGALSLTTAAMEKLHIPIQPHPRTVQYRYVREFDRLRADNFVFETRLKNDVKQGTSPCQYVRVSILCKNEFFSVTLSAKGCVANLDLYLAGHEAQAKNTDLTAFGTDLSKWVDLRCEVRNKQASLFVNGKKAYEAIAPNSAHDIVGVSYEFEGTGSVDFVRFKRPDGTSAFADDFNSSPLALPHTHSQQ
ncbi:hypothetical protein [Spirosoma radiotolerans]|uniref:hypothetical protein n=1 Tax=Spirosoma radiotolerans TaxID=1379870 RepID=UPI0006270D45|nr:hypothetical protein [Spirosoma radiotolerans]